MPENKEGGPLAAELKELEEILRSLKEGTVGDNFALIGLKSDLSKIQARIKAARQEAESVLKQADLADPKLKEILEKLKT